jgi:uncharacterized protein (DUF1800 family)
MMRRVLICGLTAIFSAADAAVDLDGDGFGDVWRLKHPGPPLVPSEDTDGDGLSNADEAIMGTNPYDALDTVRISQLRLVDAHVHLNWPSILGKRYRVECSETLAGGDWSEIGPEMAGSGTELAAVLSNATPGCFYRVRVYDTDSDGDGVTDWEEIQLGYHFDGAHHGHDHGDLARLTAALQSPSTLTITAVDASATEPSATKAGDPAMFKIQRTGGIASIDVALIKSGTTTEPDHLPLPTSVHLPMAVNEAMVILTPLADTLVESAESVIVSLVPDATYDIGLAKTAVAILHDDVQSNGVGLLAHYWKHPTTTRDAPYFTGSPTITRIDETLNFNSAIQAWPGDPITSGTTSNYFSSRWTGELLPEFTQVYTLFANADNGVRLWVNGQLLINNWPPNTVTTGEKSAVIAFEAGSRYPLVFEHYNNTSGHVAILSWQSSSQVKQVVPKSRLFPNAPPQIFGPFEEWAFVGAPEFSYQIHSSGPATSYSAAPLPEGFTINTSTGLITGNPLAPGVFDIAVSATNEKGSGSAILRLNVLQAGGGITREIWQDAPGSSITDIPLDTTPAATELLGSLSIAPDAADYYGSRIRGFLTAPTTGEYRFFLRADEAAVFWLSDDEEPVNAWKRAELSVPVSSSDWSAAAVSPLLHLEAGKRYYLEILHKEATGPDHLALGWAKPGEPDTAPSEIVPGHVLTRFEDVTLGTSSGGTLYFAQLVPQSNAVTNAYGTCTIRLSADKSTAWVTPTFANLGSAFTGMHVHDTRLPNTSNIVFDLDEPGVEILADGSYVWHITGVGALSAAEIADGIGLTSFFNVHTAVYPNGEIKGSLRALDGSSTFTPPPAPPDWTAEAAASISNVNAASRFLQQASFGANAADISLLQSIGSYEAWIEDQFLKPTSYHLPHVEQFRNVTAPSSPTYGGNLTFNSWWRNSITADDQLRQRVAFALSQIMVVSESGPLDDRANALSGYYDMLLDHAFGNVRELLEAVTLHPAMGRYLDMLRNDKPNLLTGLIPNENYAREILQLFSLGLNRMHPDGSLILNSKGLPIEVYSQDAIVGFAHGFTGWDYHYTGAYRTSFGASSNWTAPMREVPARHFIGKKQILHNVVLPGLTSVAGTPINPYLTHSATQIADPAYQALAAQELEIMHDQIFQHPNFGPFLCRQLIQRLVTSNPSRGYIYRVVQKFNDNGFGARGDMKAVIKAILLDYEARSAAASAAPSYGKQREPVLRVTQFVRAFRPANNFAGSFSQEGGLITVDTAPIAHRLVANQKVMLGFDSPELPSTDGDYSVLSVSGSKFTVRTRDIHRSNWSQSGNTLTVTTPVAHGFKIGQSIYIRFATTGLESGIYQVASLPTTTTFTVTAPSFSGSGVCDVAWLRGVYSQRTVGGITALSVTCSTLPGLGVGSKMEVNFIPITGQTLVPSRGVYTITSVSSTDPRSYTVTPDSGTLPSTTSTLSGSFEAASGGMVLDRSGTAVSGYSDWNVNSTDTDLGQTPLRSPTVFNYFLPDFQFPGMLASSGLTTPEFELSSETNVIRQANFLYGGIYSTSSNTVPTTGGYSNGFSSFKSGGHDMMMDFSPWMGARTTGTNYWTNTVNLRALIQEFSKILMAGRMSQALEDEIYTFVSNTSHIAYSSTDPSDIHRRNRIRAILYFISISPEHAIQR